jgi:hypothetical protein
VFFAHPKSFDKAKVFAVRDCIRGPIGVQVQDRCGHWEPHIQPDFTLSGKALPCKGIDTSRGWKVPERLWPAAMSLI